MARIELQVAGLRFLARLEDAAPRTCRTLHTLLPLHTTLLHARWSGEACWIPLGDVDLGLGPENATSHPAPGQLLLYPGGLSEAEVLVPYGPTLFASRVGQLAGNHFATVEDAARLPELGRLVLWQGAKQITISAC